MEQLFLSSVINLYQSLPAESPAYMDILKLVAGSTFWIGGLLGFLYVRKRKLKAAINK